MSYKFIKAVMYVMKSKKRLFQNFIIKLNENIVKYQYIIYNIPTKQLTISINLNICRNLSDSVVAGNLMVLVCILIY